ncbi:hypothetical protein BDZ45DRAFT_809031 [Acephala macrosclerotiorum]|nr:hypothetical protein BDZ45DRAFT_809031 [Acephala macrosclerotiorum]
MRSFMVLVLVAFSFMSYSLADSGTFCSEISYGPGGVYIRDGTTFTCSPSAVNEDQMNSATMPSFTFNLPTFTVTGGGRPTLPPCPSRAPGNTLSPLGCIEVLTMASFTSSPPTFSVPDGARFTLPACPPRVPGNTLSSLRCTETSLNQFSLPTRVIATIPQSYKFPQSMTVPHPASTKASSPSTSVASIFGPILHLPREETSAGAATPLQSFQPSATDSALHREPEFTATALLTMATMWSPTDTGNIPTTTSSQKSSANMSKRSSMLFLLSSTLLAVLFVSPSLATSQAGPSRCADDSSVLCLGSVTVGSFAAPPTALPSTIAITSASSSTSSISVSITIAPMSSPTVTAGPTASSKTSDTSASKRPPMSFLFLCTLLALLFASPSLADGQPSRCADNLSLLCLGSMTVGSFAAPPTAPPSTPALTSTPDPSHVSIHTTIIGTGVGSPARCSDNPNYLCIGTLTEGSFAPPPTTASSSAVSLTGSGSSSYSIISTNPHLTASQTVSASTPPTTLNSVDDSTSQSSQPPLVSTVQTTTTLGQSTTVATSVLTRSQSQHQTASLQSAGTMRMKPPYVFSFLSMLFQLFPNTSATWITKSLPPMQTFCPEDPREGCLNGTPMSELYETKAAPTTSPSTSRQITTTSCSENCTSGYVGTPSSQSLALSILAPFANITSPPSSSDSAKHTTVFIYPYSGNTTKLCQSTTPVVPYSHTQMALSPSLSAPTSVRVMVPTTCSEDESKICIGTTTVNPSPCAADAKNLCVGTVVLPTPCANNTSQMCYGTATASSTVFYQNSSMLSTISNVLTVIGRSTSTVLSTTTLPPSTSLAPAQTSAIVKSAGSLNRTPPQVFLLLWKLFALWPTVTLAETPTPPTTLSPTLMAPLPTLTATRCTADPIYGCVGTTPATNLAPSSASVSACPEQTSRFCLGGIVLGTGIQSSFWGGFSRESTSSHTSYSLFVSPTYWSSTTTPSPSSPTSTAVPTSISTTTSTPSRTVTTISTESLTSASSAGPSATPPAKSGVGKKFSSPFILLGMCLFGCLFANHLPRTGSSLPNHPSPEKTQDTNTKEGAKVEMNDGDSRQLELKLEPPEPFVEAPKSEGVVQARDTIEKSPGEIERWVESVDNEVPEEPTNENTEERNEILANDDDPELVVLGWRGRLILFNSLFLQVVLCFEEC